MDVYPAIETRFMSPTNSRGARIVATSDIRRDAKGKPWRKVISYPYEARQGAEAHSCAAAALLASLPDVVFPGVGYRLVAGYLPGGAGKAERYVFLCVPRNAAE